MNIKLTPRKAEALTHYAELRKARARKNSPMLFWKPFWLPRPEFLQRRYAEPFPAGFEILSNPIPERTPAKRQPRAMRETLVGYHSPYRLMSRRIDQEQLFRERE